MFGAWILIMGEPKSSPNDGRRQMIKHSKQKLLHGRNGALDYTLN